jgi:dienelactone hydrolase
VPEIDPLAADRRSLDVVRRAARIAGPLLLLVAILALVEERSAMGAVLDLRRAGFIAAIAGAGILTARLPRVLSTRRSGAASGAALARPGVAAAFLLPGLAVVVLGFHLERFLLTHREEEVRFRNGAVELAGTLHLPRRASGAVPAVVIVHGSGRVTRKEPAFYARVYARHGVAALAYDKRGSGESTGRLYEAHYRDLALDAAAGIALLKSRPEIDPRRIGILGFSEGEWVGLLASGITGDLAFLQVVSPSARSPADQVAWELEARLRAAGFDDGTVGKAAALNARLLDYQRHGADAGADTSAGADALRADLAAAGAEPWFAPAELPGRLYPPEDYAWWRSVMDFDPIPLWRRVTCPVLLVSGGRDLNSPVRDSQKRIRSALLEGGNPRFTGRVYEDADHGLVEWWLPGGLPPPRFPRGYPELLAEWARRVNGAPANM